MPTSAKYKNPMIGGNSLTTTSGGAKPNATKPNPLLPASAARETEQRLQAQLDAYNQQQGLADQHLQAQHSPTAGQAYAREMAANPAMAARQEQHNQFSMTPGGASMLQRFGNGPIRPLTEAPRTLSRLQEMQQRGASYDAAMEAGGGIYSTNDGQTVASVPAGRKGYGLVPTGDGEYAVTTDMPPSERRDITAMSADKRATNAMLKEKQEVRARGGHLRKLDSILTRASRGLISPEQVKAMSTQYANSHGLMNDSRVKAIMDQYTPEDLKAGRGRKRLGETGEAFVTGLKPAGKYTPSEVQSASDNVKALLGVRSIQRLGITAETDMRHDVNAMVQKFDDMADLDLQEWATMFSEKNAATNGDYSEGSSEAIVSIAEQIAQAIDDNDTEALTEHLAAYRKQSLAEARKPVYHPPAVGTPASR